MRRRDWDWDASTAKGARREKGELAEFGRGKVGGRFRLQPFLEH